MTEEEAIYVQPIGHYTAATGLNRDPTGATLYAPNGSILPSPGNIAVGGLVLNTTAGNPRRSGRYQLDRGRADFFERVGESIESRNTQSTNPQPCPVTAINPDIRNAYVTEWNFGIQHAFTGSMSLEVSYVGNHATRLGC